MRNIGEKLETLHTKTGISPHPPRACNRSISRVGSLAGEVGEGKTIALERAGSQR